MKLEDRDCFGTRQYSKKSKICKNCHMFKDCYNEYKRLRNNVYKRRLRNELGNI